MKTTTIIAVITIIILVLWMHEKAYQLKEDWRDLNDERTFK